jgi:hypothetical protein
MKVIQLFEFAFLPKWPGVKGLDFAAGEATKSILSGGDVLRLEGMDGEVDFISGKSEDIVRLVVSESMDSTEGIDVEKEVVVIGVIRSSMSNKVKFAMNLSAGGMSREGFGSKSDMEQGAMRVETMQATEFASVIRGGKNGCIVNTSEIGANVFTTGGAVRATQASGTSRGTDGRDIGAVVDGAGTDIKTKGRVSAAELHAFILVV